MPDAESAQEPAEKPDDVPPEEPAGQPRHWIAVTPGSLARLPEDERHQVEQVLRQRAAARGALMAVVEVRVYEHLEEPQVSFHPDGLLGPGADRAAIDAVVARARDSLAAWGSRRTR